MLTAEIAKLCHEVNRAYCESLGDMSQPRWEDAPDWQRQSAINGVKFHMTGEFTPEQSHEMAALLSRIRRDYASVVLFDRAL